MLSNNQIEHYLIQTFVHANVPATSTVSETYGEVLFLSFAALIKKMPINQSDVFVDFGSGLGKLCLQVFLSSSIKKVVGIEINPDLHQQAQFALNEMKNKVAASFENRSLEFHLGDFLNFDLGDATIMFVGSPCYTQSILDEIGYKINSSQVHTVYSLKAIRTLERLKFRGVRKLECSWDSALCYHYSI